MISLSDDAAAMPRHAAPGPQVFSKGEPMTDVSAHDLSPLVGPALGFAGAIAGWLAARRKNAADAGKSDAEARKADADARKADADAAAEIEAIFNQRIKLLLDGYERQRQMDQVTIAAMKMQIDTLEAEIEDLKKALTPARRDSVN